jgi:general secretion pathway protein F
MPTFVYRGFATEGAAVRGDIVAEGPKQARQLLAERGIMVETLSGAALGRHRLDVASRSLFYREMAALVEGGMAVVEALALLAGMPEMKRSRRLLLAARDAVEAGDGLAVALEAACPDLGPFERAIFRVAEQSGQVETALATLADYLDEQAQIRARVQSALMYPAIVASVGTVLGIIMLAVLLPRAQGLFEVNGVAPPLLTRVAMRASAWAFDWGWIVLLVAIFVGWVLWRRRRRYVAVTDRVRLRIPVIGRGYRLLIQARFAEALALLLRTGMSVVDALPLAGEASGSSICAAATTEQAECVRHGTSLSDAIQAVPLLSASLPQWVRTGEHTGDLSGMLSRGAERVRREWDRYITRVLALLEPALILLVGAFVLVVVLSVLLPMMSLGQGLGL